MKTQNKKLTFTKKAITELNKSTLEQIRGGGTTTDGQTTFVCGDCITRVTFTIIK